MLLVDVELLAEVVPEDVELLEDVVLLLVDVELIVAVSEVELLVDVMLPVVVEELLLVHVVLLEVVEVAVEAVEVVVIDVRVLVNFHRTSSKPEPVHPPIMYISAESGFQAAQCASRAPGPATVS